jgi:hypothetical protein
VKPSGKVVRLSRIGTVKCWLNQLSRRRHRDQQDCVVIILVCVSFFIEDPGLGQLE